MPVKNKFYNPSTRTDEATYESSNVIYSKFVEDETTNTGDLYVVFKGGKQYLYQDVTYEDYLMFKHGCVENSSGKSLNIYIVKKYFGEKLEDVDLDKLLRGMENKVAEEDPTGVWFVHGSEEYSEEIFQTNYEPTINYVLGMDPNAKFIFCNGDRYGEQAALYLVKNSLVGEKQLVCLFAPDDKLLAEISDAVKTLRVVPGAKTPADVFNYAMEKSSDDICFVSERTLDKIRLISEGAYSILKRRFN